MRRLLKRRNSFIVLIWSPSSDNHHWLQKKLSLSSARRSLKRKLPSCWLSAQSFLRSSKDVIKIIIILHIQYSCTTLLGSQLSSKDVIKINHHHIACTRLYTHFRLTLLRVYIFVRNLMIILFILFLRWCTVGRGASEGAAMANTRRLPEFSQKSLSSS